MADDSPDIVEEHPFHPTDPPQGMRHYDIGSLSSNQMRMLNRMKTIQRKENEIYLSLHPEIEGLISILLRHILKESPIFNVHEEMGSFFARPRCEIATELLRHMVDTGYTGDLIDKLKENVQEDNIDTSRKENDVIEN